MRLCWTNEWTRLKITLRLGFVEYKIFESIKWKQQFEADIHYGHLGKDKPQTAQEQEISVINVFIVHTLFTLTSIRWSFSCDNLIEFLFQFLQHEKQSLKSALNPLLREYKQIVSLARTDAHRKFKWGGLFLLSAQLGFVARLTWFEYSWDIMEPITWMLTYAMMVGWVTNIHVINN